MTMPQYFWGFGFQWYLLANMSRRSSAHGVLIISGMKADGSEAGIPGKKEKMRCDCVKFSGEKMVTGISIWQ